MGWRLDTVYSKKILVTGGTGFIGWPLCHRLAGRGAKVFVLTRRPYAVPRGVTPITSMDQIAKEAMDIIINLAGEPIAQRWTLKAQEKIKNSRMNVTASIIDYIQLAPSRPSLFISGSAIGYYGTDNDTVFSEGTPPAAGAPFSRALCAAWEAEAMKADPCGVRTVLLRIGAVLEQGGGILGRLLTPFRLGLGGPLGRGDQWLSWIDREDLLRMIFHIIDNPSIHGPINGTAPTPVTNKLFAHTLAEQLNRPCFFTMPPFVLRLIFGEMADEIMIKGQKVVPTKALEGGFVFSYPDLTSSLGNILRKNTVINN